MWARRLISYFIRIGFLSVWLMPASPMAFGDVKSTGEVIAAFFTLPEEVRQKRISDYCRGLGKCAYDKINGVVVIICDDQVAFLFENNPAGILKGNWMANWGNVCLSYSYSQTIDGHQVEYKEAAALAGVDGWSVFSLGTKVGDIDYEYWFKLENDGSLKVKIRKMKSQEQL